MKLPAWLVNPRAWLRERARRIRVRAELLATPGVDFMVQEVMDLRYGVHNWRVTNGMLEAQVMTPGAANPWWGPIGELGNVATRNWLVNIWCEMKGLDPPEVSHAKVPLHQFPLEPMSEAGYYQRAYEDTQPEEDRHGRTH